MKQQPKQDLRYLKNENLIRETFRKMICEMDYSKISIKELAQRAQINRKTFYLHYSSLDHLLAVLQLEIMEPTVQMISETKFPEDAEIIIKKSFEIMASLDWADKKILSTKGDLPEKKGPFRFDPRAAISKIRPSCTVQALLKAVLSSPIFPSVWA